MLFISHSSQDEKSALALCEELERASHRCWLAQRDILAGQEWADSIITAIGQSSAMLLVFSKNSHDSPQVLREVNQRDRCRLRPEIPDGLKHDARRTAERPLLCCADNRISGEFRLLKPTTGQPLPEAFQRL